MISISSNTTSTIFSTTPSTSTVENTSGENVGNSFTSLATAEVTESNNPIISVQGTILSSLFDAADEFIRNEHLVPYQGIRYSNGTWGTIKDYEGAYIDIGKYNSYLFDKAAATLVAQAKEKGIELDVKDVLAQLKANNAEIAAMKLDDQDRRERLGTANTLSRLSYSDLQSFTDMYITAKENGLDTEQVYILASTNAWYKTKLEEPYFVWATRDPKEITEDTLKIAEVVRSKMTDFFGIGNDFFNFILDPTKGLALNSLPISEANKQAIIMLDFLTKLLDLKDQGLYYSSEKHDSFLNKSILQNQPT